LDQQALRSSTRHYKESEAQVREKTSANSGAFIPFVIARLPWGLLFSPEVLQERKGVLVGMIEVVHAILRKFVVNVRRLGVVIFPFLRLEILYLFVKSLVRKVLLTASRVYLKEIHGIAVALNLL